MTYNPYAPPAAPSLLGPSQPGAPGEPQPWDVGDAIRSAWAVYKTNWAPLTAGLLVTGALGVVPQQVPAVLFRTELVEEGTGRAWAISFVFGAIAFVVREFFAAGFTRACLGTLRTGTTRFGDIFGAGDRFVPYLITSFLMALAIAMGLVVFIVPGLILGLGLWMSRFYVIDQGMGPAEALRASWDASAGQKSAFFVLALAELGLFIVGLATCCVGALVAEMVMMLARTVVYLRIAGLAHGTHADLNAAARTGAAVN
jgi:hypothetical protein